MCESLLHGQVDELQLVDWHIYTILHVMVCTQQIITLECHSPSCRLDTREFDPTLMKSGKRGIALDHIIMRSDNGHHQIHNLRPVHRSCNSGWRKGKLGTFHTDESRAVISDRAKQQHSDGRGPNYQDPTRNAKISEAVKERYRKLRE